MFPATSHWFPRINVRDPYKRLGISKMASEDEIQGASNFLIQQYAGHIPSVDAIESAHDKIIMQKFHERKNPKIDITKKVRQVRQAVQSCELCFREIPSSSHCFSCQNGSHVRSSRRSDGSVPDSAGFVISSTYVLLHPALVFPLRVISKAHHTPKKPLHFGT